MKPELWTQTPNADIYVPTADVNHAVILCHGLVCEKTFTRDFVESAVGDSATGVVVVQSTPTRRPQTTQEAIQEGSEQLETDTFNIVCHSLAYLDTAELLAHQTKKGSGLKIGKVTVFDGVNSNGRIITHAVARELRNTLRSPATLRQTVNNVLNNIPGQAYECARASMPRKAKTLFGMCDAAGVQLQYVFHHDDNIIRMPTDRVVNFYVRNGCEFIDLPGHHMSLPHGDQASRELAFPAAA